MDGVLTATFVYPLCVDQTVEIALKMLGDPSYAQFTVAGQP
jgi:hypothetical protein